MFLNTPTAQPKTRIIIFLLLSLCNRNTDFPSLFFKKKTYFYSMSPTSRIFLLAPHKYLILAWLELYTTSDAGAVCGGGATRRLWIEVLG